MEFHVEYHDGFFIGTTSGDAVDEQFGDLLDAMLTHDMWQPGTPWLHDHSDLNSSSLTIDGIQRIAQLCAERRTLIGKGKCAIVVARDLEFGLARMWAAHVENNWDAVTAVFRSREEAIAWLDV